MNERLKCAFTLFAACFCAVTAPAQAPELFNGPFLFEGATIHGDRIAFGRAGGIWLAGKSGGTAERLTEQSIHYSMPVFSPDGSRIAAARRAGRTTDIYLLNPSTRKEERLTHHPGRDWPVGWSADSQRVLFNSNRDGNDMLYTMAPGDQLPTTLDLPQAYSGSFSPDGKRLAYLPRSFDYHHSEYRYYRGGQCSPLWIVDLDSGAVESITAGNDNVRDPMWIDELIYFLWDRDGRFDLFVYDLASKETRKLTDLGDFEARTATTDGHSIVLVGIGEIRVFDVSAETISPVAIAMPLDVFAHRARVVNAFGQVQSYSLAASGTRAVICARGDVFIVDTATGAASNQTKTPGVAEREAALSPDGKQLAYFSDASGEYALEVRAVDSEKVTTIAIEEHPTFYSELTWSPDGNYAAFSDHNLVAWLAEVAAGAVKSIDRSTSSAQGLFAFSWSPDARYLAYGKHGENRLPRVFVHDVTTGENHPVTPENWHVSSPIFDRTGKYLYFISSPNAAASDFGWGVLAGMLSQPLVIRQLNAVVLREDDPAPVSPQGPNLAVDWKNAADTPIDFDGIESRIVPIDVTPRLPAELAAGPAGLVYMVVDEWPETPGSGFPQQSLYRLDLRAPADPQKAINIVQAYAVSGDGASILCNDASNLRTALRQDTDDAQPIFAANWRMVTFRGAKAETKPVPLAALAAPVEPAREWQQIFRESWRLMRDVFYDPNHHGLDWDAIEERYAEFLPGISSREELNTLMERMQGHVSCSHLGVGGGDIPPSLEENERVGLLGADFEIADGHFRFKRILRPGLADAANPALRAPLAQLGAEVKEGEFLLAIDEKPLDASYNLYEALRDKASRPTRILIGPTADGANARELQVIPVADEMPLRLSDWAERNRERVLEATSGKLGYFHVSNFGIPGVQDFMRGYYGARLKPGMIIDQRFNGGGITPDYFVELLARKPLYNYQFREGDDLPVPVNGRANGSTVLITNEHNWSAAETMATMFQLANIGPIVGRTTAGGVIGPYGARRMPGLVDGGSMRIPSRAAYTYAGAWIENDGIHPNIEVDITPADWRAARDPQLEAAINAGLESIATESAPTIARPAFPTFP